MKWRVPPPAIEAASRVRSMDFLYVANNVIILFLLLGVGYGSSVTGILNQNTTCHLSKFVLYVTLPALIVASMQVPITPELVEGMRDLALAILVFYAVSLPIAWIVPGLLNSPPEEASIYRFVLVFSNIAFMGFPIIENLFGTEGLFYAAIFNIPFRVLIFSIGVLMITGAGSAGRRLTPGVLASPAILASFLGLALFLTGVRIPSPLIDLLDLLGGTTTTLAMVVVGSILASLPAREVVQNRKAYLVSLTRLLLIPAVLWLVLRTVTTDPLVIGVVVMLGAMPAAANCALLAGEYGANPELASSIVFISTLGSVLTIPFIATVLF